MKVNFIQYALSNNMQQADTSTRDGLSGKNTSSEACQKEFLAEANKSMED